MKLNSISLFQATTSEPLYSSYAPLENRSLRSPVLILPNNFKAADQHPKLSEVGSSEAPTFTTLSLSPNPGSGSGPAEDKTTSSRSRQLIQPPTGRELNRTTDSITTRPERESSIRTRTELEMMLRTALTRPTLVQPPMLGATMNDTQQVSLNDPPPKTSSAINQAAAESAVNSTRQRAPLAVDLELGRPKSERGLRSTGTPPANSDSVVISKAQLANLLDLAAKSVQRLQAPPNVTTTTATTTATTTTTTTSSTTVRPQFKSSLPKRLTIFKQLQKPFNRTTFPTMAPISRTTTATATTTTTRVPPIDDVTKIISLPKQQVHRIYVSREDGNELSTDASLMDDSQAPDYSNRIVSTNTRERPSEFSGTGRPFPSVESDPPPASGRVYAPKAERPHEAPEPPLDLSADDFDARKRTADESEDSEPDSESSLPPVPNYTNDNDHDNNSTETETETESETETSNQPEESQTLSVIAAAASMTKRWGDFGDAREVRPLGGLEFERLVMDRPAQWEDQLVESSERSQQRQPTFADYLLPIVYQYHILIIAILFSMWLDSLRTANVALPVAPQSAGSSLRRQRQQQSDSARSRSAESGFGARHGHRRRVSQHQTRRGSQESSTSISGSNLSRSNSLRASSEQLLSFSGKSEGNTRRAAGAAAAKRRHESRPNWEQSSIEEGSSLQSISSSRSPNNPPRPVRLIIRRAVREDARPASSACSVFFGLLVVSLALIVVLLGLQLLTILNQCLTQLLSILVCLVGLCVAWRTQSKFARTTGSKFLSAPNRSGSEADGRLLLLSGRGAAYLTNPNDILLSDKRQASGPPAANEMAPPIERHVASNHRQCFHYLFLLAAYFCGVSIGLNLGKQHSVQQLFPAHIMQFIQRLASHKQPLSEHNHHQQQDNQSTAFLQDWGLIWGSNWAPTEPVSPLILFHIVLASKGLLLILQVTLQTILIRSSCNQRTTHRLRQVYTFLMFSNLSLWAMDICEQQQHLQRAPETSFDELATERLRLITLDGFTQFASSIVTLSHLYHGLVFMQH